MIRHNLGKLASQTTALQFASHAGRTAPTSEVDAQLAQRRAERHGRKTAAESRRKSFATAAATEFPGARAAERERERLAAELEVTDERRHAPRAATDGGGCGDAARCWRDRTTTIKDVIAMVMGALTARSNRRGCLSASLSRSHHGARSQQRAAITTAIPHPNATIAPHSVFSDQPCGILPRRRRFVVVWSSHRFSSWRLSTARADGP